jgi:hypothetical protein
VVGAQAAVSLGKAVGGGAEVQELVACRERGERFRDVETLKDEETWLGRKALEYAFKYCSFPKRYVAAVKWLEGVFRHGLWKQIVEAVSYKDSNLRIKT